MANLLKIKRGTRAQLNAAVTGNTLNLGEPYLITDENRIAVGTGSNSYEVFAKSSEVQALDADLTSISGLSGTGFLKRSGADTYVLDNSTYLTAESDTLATVTGRGASTTTAVTLTGGVTLNAAGSTNGAIFAGSTSGTTKVVASAVAGTTTLTLPASTGTVALTSDLPTVNNGTLTFSVGAAGASNTTVTVGTGTGYSANTATNTTYSISVGPALTALATFMNTATAGFIRRTGTDTYAIDTSTYLTANQSISISGDASGTGTTAITLTLANSGVTAGTYTKVQVDAKGRVIASSSLVAADIPTLTASKISDFDTQVRTSTVAQLAAPAAALAMNSQKITGLADPTAAQDAATKNYVDLAIQGLDPKASTVVATTANLTVTATTQTLTNSGAQAALAIDGITLTVNDRVLVKDQTTAAQNGIFVVTNIGSASTNWVLTRADDASLWAELPAAFVFVERGTTNAENGFLFTVDQGGTLGTTPITITQFSGAGQITAGNGLTKTGNTIDVVGTANRITVAADAIDIASTYVGQTTITTLGTVGTGTWNATAIGVTKGGLGLTAAITGLLKGNGTSYSAATEGTDYLSANSTIDGGTF
jgi:hypothetical protein